MHGSLHEGEPQKSWKVIDKNQPKPSFIPETEESHQEEKLMPWVLQTASRCSVSLIINWCNLFC